MSRKTPKDVRDEAMRLALAYSDDRRSTGDPEGADEFADLARAIRRIRLTKQSTI